jgi:hypothetical protein
MLAEAQKRLEEHFTGLASERSGYGYPVYALEHGLEREEVEALRRGLQEDLSGFGYPQRKYWLLWIIVAAEVGYAYDGDEYWISFAAHMPEWSRFGSRETIRQWFRTFASDFAGFSPQGRWAEHFSIIAWPITHSILPLYLQYHFAQHLHDLRYELARRDDIGIEQLGEFLRERYQGHSSRFGNFLEQAELTSRLVLALRDDDVQDTVAPVSKATLSRIVSDLESHRSARDYLSAVRRILREARLRGSGRLVGGSAGHPATASGIGGGGLKLVARRSSAGSWRLGITFPDFAGHLRLSGAKAGALDATRVRLSDKPETWMPGRALLSYSGKEQPLGILPLPLTRPVVEFERQVTGFSDLLSPKLQIQGSPPWLLRVQGDGAARQVLGNHVRSGRTYALITQDPIADDIARNLRLEPQDCQTKNILLYLFEVPAGIGPRYLQSLAQLKLGYALQAHVEPVGLIPRWDDTLGGSVWLPTEELLLRIWADFDVREFAIRVDGGDRTLIPIHNSNETIVSLGTLPIGRHVIEVIAAPARGLGGAQIARLIEPEQFVVEVRSPVPWREGIKHQAGIRAVLEPAESSFEDVLSGRAEITLHGPTGRSATAEVRLFDTNGHQAEGAELARLPVPSSAHAIQRAIEKLRTEPLSEKVQGAPRVDLLFRVEELGASSLTFSRDVEPLRWKLEPKDTGYAVRLIDEAGSYQQILVERFDIRVPDRRIALQLNATLAGVLVEAPGSLFVARQEKRTFAAIASVLQQKRLTTFSDLGVDIALASPLNSPRRIALLLALQRRWGRARALGRLGAIRKANVLEAFEHQIARMTCGATWADWARECLAGRPELLDRLQREVGGSPGFASRMRNTLWHQPATNPQCREEFLKIARTYGIAVGAEVCELALRLAFRPGTIRLGDPDKVARAFEELAGNPVVARGAYLVKLATDMTARGRAASTGGEAG